MKPSEIREKTDSELVKQLGELEEGVFKLRFRKGAGESPRPNVIRDIKRDIARIKTVMNERKAGVERKAK